MLRALVTSARSAFGGGPGAVYRERLVDVSETYTAVYERDGEAWIAQIAEEPRVRSRGPSLVEARESIREVLAQWLKRPDTEELHIIDQFRLPTQIRAAREAVQATRTETERTEMMASMTDSRSAMSWAKELGISMRDPVTVKWLENLGDREVSIDTFCHTITMAEEMARFGPDDGGLSLDDACESEPPRAT